MITVEDIAVELGRTTPTAESVTARQWQVWIDRAYATIQRRAESLGVDYASLEPEDVDEVATYIVLRLARAAVASGAESSARTVTVDDATVRTEMRYRPLGDAFVLDDWWSILGLLDAGVTEWCGSIACR